MSRFIASLAMGVLTLSAAQPAFAASDTPSNASEMSNSSIRTYLGDERLGFKPALGFIEYNNSQGDRDARATYGLTAEFNAASMIGSDFTRYFIGAQSGFAYSHLGNAGANLVGRASSADLGEGGANFAMIPLNLAVGYAPLRWLRVGVHGGGNVIYRSMLSSLRIGANSTDTGSGWNIFANTGGDLNVSIGHGIDFSVRPDWTLASDNTMFATTLALGFTL